MKKINFKEVRSLALTVFLVFAFRSACFEPFRIPTGSMIPTIKIGDFIVVNKFSYGIKLPFSDMFSAPIYLIQFDEPKKEDIIVFKYPMDPSISYIKRVIGTPGDEIELVNKSVYVNGKIVTAMNDNSSKTLEFATSFDGIKVDFFKVKGPRGDYDIQMTNKETRVDTVAKFKVPEGKFFVMGDNRDFSADSRYWGFVPKENIKGRALFVWMSLTTPFSDEGMTVTPSRIGKVLL